MTEICREIVDHPSAWVRAPKETFLRQLGDAEIDALERLVAATRHRKPLEVTRDEFDAPEVRGLAAEVMRELRDGHGLMVISGLAPERFSPEDYERIYWGLGTHIGKASVQNALGDFMGYVEEEPDPDNPYDPNTRGRGYRSSAPAGFHTDTREVVGLMCVERAESGGESVMASVASIHNDFVRNHPELLDAMYEGYYCVLGPRQEVTPEKSPVFGFIDGRLSIWCQFKTMRDAAERRGEQFPPALDAAISYFYERAEENAAEFVLEPGEIFIWNNRNQVHGRRGFKNSETRRRLLLRIWLQPEDALPLPEYSGEHTHQRLREEEVVRLRELAAAQ